MGSTHAEPSGAPRRAPVTGPQRISVVTIAWRNEQHATGFVSSLRAALADAAEHGVDLDTEVVLVVNGPEGEAAVPAFAPLRHAGRAASLSVLRLDANTGFSGGAAAGVAGASGDIVVVANLDLRFDRRFLTSLADVDAEWDLLVPDVTEPSPAGPMRHGVARRRWFHRHQWVTPPEEAGPVAAGNGSCVVLSRATVDRRIAERGALFDPEYHSFNEDIDLFWWANRLGLRTMYEPGLRVEHGLAGSHEGRHRFADRTPEVQVRAMANFRVTAFKHAHTIREWAGWVVGEVVYAGQAVHAAGLRGVARYGQSWKLSARTIRHIRRRRGRLR